MCTLERLFCIAGNMKLSLYADYSCRIMMYLCYRTEELSQIKDIAEKYDISHDHLRKIVYRLGTLGYLESTKGKSGGVRLIKPAEDIRIGDFLRLVEPSEEFVECMRQGDHRCLITKPCRLKSALKEALDQFYQHLNKYTFADLVDNNRLLENLIGKIN